MIARVWQGRALPGKMEDYAEHLRRAVRPELEQLDGFKGLYLLRRDSAGDSEVLVLTLWDSLAAITAFAGDDPERAVVAPAAQAMFHSYDSLVKHFEVTVKPGDE